MDGSMVFAQQVESLKQQHDSLKKTLTQPERTMTVCEVCGVFINSTDNEQRRKASSVSCLLAFPAHPLVTSQHGLNTFDLCQSIHATGQEGVKSCGSERDWCCSFLSGSMCDT